MVVFSNSKTTITWNLDKEDLIKAYQTNKPLSLTYQLQHKKKKKNKGFQELVRTEVRYSLNNDREKQQNTHPQKCLLTMKLRKFWFLFLLSQKIQIRW